MIKFVLSKIAPYFILVAAVLLLSRSFIRPGIPDTHDGHSHVARIANYYLAIRDGHFPVRWAPNLNYKFGYPVFQYHYQTSYFLATVFYKVGFSLEDSYKLVYVCASLIAVFALFWWLKKELKTEAALIGALLYISAPPLILQIFVRGAFGEYLGWCVLPVLFLAIDRFIDSRKQARLSLVWFLLGSIAVAMLVLSHIMLASFGLIFAFIYGLVRQGPFTTRLIKKQIGYLLLFISGLGLSSFFLLPAILESKFVNLAAVSLLQSFTDHLISIGQFIYSPWQYGYSVKGPGDTLSFMLGAIQILLLVTALVFLGFKKHIFTNKTGIINYFIVSTLLSVFMMSTMSKPIWDMVPYLRQLQFPWRLLALPTFSMAVIGAYLLHAIHNKFAYILVSVVCVAQIMSYAKPEKLLHLSDYMYFEFPFTSSVNNETMPVHFDMYKNLAYTFQVKDLNNMASVAILDWRTARHMYTVESTASAMIVERLAHMPGWETTVDGVPVQLNIKHSDYPGMPVFAVPSGKHEVVTQFRENTLAKRVGNGLSIISLLGLILFSILFLKRNYDK